MNTYNKAADELFFSKNDPQDIRLGDIVQRAEPSQIPDKSFVISGYPDDEGILLNGGRIGAAEAPDQIRRLLYKMTPPENFNPKLGLFDIGNLTKSSSLENRHLQARQTALQLYAQGAFPISFGGGHDYGFPDAAAFCEFYLQHSTHQPIVINFDAHLDVRPTTKSLNSGTPFFRLLEEFSDKIQLIEIGLQPQCNSTHHARWARERGAQLFFLPQILESGLESLLNSSGLQNTSPQTPVFVSFDIDCLSSAEAPGCSQSWPTGLKLQDCLSFLKQLRQQVPVKGLGIYEVSPQLDIAFQTSKAAALLTYNSIFQDVL